MDQTWTGMGSKIPTPVWTLIRTRIYVQTRIQIPSQTRIYSVIASRLVYSILLVNTHNAAKPPSALNVTLSYLLLSAGALLQHGARSAPSAIDLYCLPAGRSAENSPAAVAAVAAVDRRDRQTDGRTLNQCIDPAAHTVRSVVVMCAFH